MNETEPKVILLLVEDEAIIALALAQIIKSFGYEVIIAHSGEQAVKLCTGSDTIKLVLMDIDLGPGIDGPESARRILAARNLPIVFCTSHSEKEYVEKVKAITRYGYVVKNSGNFVLRTTIEMAFELFEANLASQLHFEEEMTRMGVVNRQEILEIFGRFISELNELGLFLEDAAKARKRIRKLCDDYEKSCFLITEKVQT